MPSMPSAEARRAEVATRPWEVAVVERFTPATRHSRGRTDHSFPRSALPLRLKVCRVRLRIFNVNGEFCAATLLCCDELVRLQNVDRYADWLTSRLQYFYWNTLCVNTLNPAVALTLSSSALIV